MGVNSDALGDGSALSALRKLVDALGIRLVSVSVGVSDATVIRGWLADAQLPDDDPLLAARIETLDRFVETVGDLYSIAVVARLLRSAQPDLDDRSPMVVIADAQSRSDLGAVLACAQNIVRG